MAFDAFALILAMLAIGMLFARLRLLPDDADEVLNLVMLYVCLSAAVLVYVPRLHLDVSLLGLIATPWLLAVSLTIRLRLSRDELAPLAVGLALRLLVLPALALGLSLAFGMSGDMLRANVLESAMPSMITAAALAISHGLAPRLAAARVGYGTVLSLATLPAWAWVAGLFA